MINIAHPRVSTKPPISKCCKEKIRIESEGERQEDTDLQKAVDLTMGEEFLQGANATSEEIDTMIKTIGFDIKKLQSACDCNQNSIEPDSCSFEQLCTMINDLEENMTDDNPPRVKEIKVSNACNMKCESSIYQPEYLSNQVKPEKDYSKKPCSSSASTYEDIMSLLGVLEQEGYLTNAPSNNTGMHSRNIIGELFMNNQSLLCPSGQRNDQISRHIPESLKEDLATARLQLEDREATVKILKSELKTLRHSTCEKLEAQMRQHTADLEAEKTKYQAVIKRHQKFIERLISEKKDLTERCNALTERVKEMEMKQQREVKVMMERHGVELQRARELSAASEKIRRERWVEAKTSKIKEMTVKGLEPELRSMVEQHQQEVQEIRSAHIKELQDTELRTIRRSNQQLEQLRLELTASHEKILTTEKEILRTRYQEKLEQQESLFQEQRRKLLDELESEKKMLCQDLARRDAEKDAIVQQARSQFHEKLNTITRQHQIEKRTLQESLKMEQETRMENCRRQYNANIEKMEAQLRDECSRERDRQIEIAIERLEKETLEMKTSLQQTTENRLRCLKEKYEVELQDANDNEQFLTTKVASIQEKLKDAERHLQQTEDNLQQCMNQLNNSNQVLEKLTVERNNAKMIVRQEIETEKRDLEDKIASLYRELTESNANRNNQMAQLYSRVKLIVTQKDVTIAKLLKVNDEMRKKCDHLGKLLDQQRKDYVLKSL